MYNFVQKYFAQIVHFYIDNNTARCDGVRGDENFIY